MDRLSAMQLFVRVVETKSFSKAARASGLTQSTTSKQIVNLETHLGVQLLRRTSRGLNVTAAGQQFYVSAIRILSDVEESEARVGRSHMTPSGLARVAISPGLARMHVIPRLPGFFEQFPSVSIDFEVSERHVNLIEENIDVAIRIGHLSDSTLLAQRIGSVEVATVATPDYLKRHGIPATPSDLEQHNCVVFMRRGVPRPWQFKSPSGPLSYIPKGSIRSNDAEHIRAAVLAGLGVAHNVSWLFDAELAAGQVTRLLTNYVPDLYPINAVRPAGRRLPEHVKVFIDFVAETLSRNPHLMAR